jgi:hypothetical protein
MKRSAIWAAASLLAAAVGVSGSCLAAEGGALKSGSVLGALAAMAVPTAELGKERARGLNVNVNGSAALNSGNSANNAVVASPVTGMIDNEHSINNNVGITSVLQNFGNNSVMQSSTTINITVH